MRISNARKRTRWYRRIERSSDPILALSVLAIAENWAERMERQIDQGSRIGTIAEATHRAASSGVESLRLHSPWADLMVDFLEDCWAYGSSLRDWYGKAKS